MVPGSDLGKLSQGADVVSSDDLDRTDRHALPPTSVREGYKMKGEAGGIVHVSAATGKSRWLSDSGGGPGRTVGVHV